MGLEKVWKQNESSVEIWEPPSTSKGYFGIIEHPLSALWIVADLSIPGTRGVVLHCSQPLFRLEASPRHLLCPFAQGQSPGRLAFFNHPILFDIVTGTLLPSPPNSNALQLTMTQNSNLPQALTELRTAFDSPKGSSEEVTKRLSKLRVSHRSRTQLQELNPQLELVQSGLYFAPPTGNVEDLVATRLLLTTDETQSF